MSNCLQCINSGCCKEFDVEVSRLEYEKYDSSIQSHFIKKSEQVINSDSYAGMSEQRALRFIAHIDKESGDSFAKLKKDDEGYCTLLNKENMICTIYEKRPKVCREFKESRCSEIRVLENGN